ncbi:MAG TPA: four-carbon acid sugar kinase family protein [Verrucomicrobiae bacterium]|nr:four-carbon acid sugar kinase family protein [Verrucomicrobiae bacterium]
MIGVIADDLTGAAEIGAIGLRHGLRAEIIFSGEPSGDADLVCVDADSRSQTADEAARRAADAAKLLRDAGAKWIYKKVDSVLRGHVSAEIEAVMKQLDFQCALLAPANPSLGRTIFNGNYFVGSKPIHKTEFVRDPQFPRRSPQVLELVKLPPTFSINVCKAGEKIRENGIVIAEAATSADVAQWAKCHDEKIFPAGGAEFFNALLTAKNAGDGTVRPENLLTGGEAREFFVSGTASVSARKFAAAAKREKTPVFSLPLELSWGANLVPAAVDAIGQRIVAAFDSHRRVVLTVGLPQMKDSKASEKLSEHIAQIAVSALRHANVSHIFSEGGATSAALVRQMGWKRLKVLCEEAPGVATLLADGEKKILLTIKPGSYSWPQEFIKN